ncbi:MAG: hypothetical protein GX937_07285 [Lentisphaerae bacterium]|nr:hypothetical protein [Lentisphaerota bacterium]
MINVIKSVLSIAQTIRQQTVAKDILSKNGAACTHKSDFCHAGAFPGCWLRVALSSAVGAAKEERGEREIGSKIFHYHSLKAETRLASDDSSNSREGRVVAEKSCQYWKITS